MTLPALSTRSLRTRTAARVLAVLAVAALLVGSARTPAAAHPFGEPQTLEISATADRVVSIAWRVGGVDDLSYLGLHLGVLPQERVLLDGAVMLEPEDPALLAGSQELRDYLLERIQVSSGGASCRGEVVEIGDLARGPARLEFTCPGPVTTASVTARMLTDLHPAYRTLATGPQGQRAAYGADAETHDWALPASAASEAEPLAAGADLGRSAAVQIGAVLGPVLLLVLLAGGLLRRRRSRSTPPLT